VPLIYRPRRPWTTALYQCIDRHLETFAAVYEERFAPTYHREPPTLAYALFLERGRDF